MCDPTLSRYGTDFLQVRLVTFGARPPTGKTEGADNPRTALRQVVLQPDQDLGNVFADFSHNTLNSSGVMALV